MHRHRGEAAVHELLLQLRGGALRAHEDDGLAAALRLQDAADHLVLVERVRAVHDVLDVRLRDSLVGIGRADVDRIPHEAARERHDRAGHRGGEEHRVARRRRQREQLLDVGEEPEIEHLVGLVEHHLAHLSEVEEPLVREIEQTPRRADDDLRPGPELLDLALVRLAAVDRHDGGRTILRGQLEILVDLHGELAGRHDHERLHAGCRIGSDALQQREAEAEGLAGAGLRLADDVLPRERERDRLLLDREGFRDTAIQQGVDHVLVDAEFEECRHSASFSMSAMLRAQVDRRSGRCSDGPGGV